MASFARHRRRTTNIWPGYVDALATLLMVLIFLLLIFVLSQVLLSEVLSGRDAALRALRSQVDELAELLALEQETQQQLRDDVVRLNTQLQSTLAERHELTMLVDALTDRAEAAEARALKIGDVLAEAEADLDAQRQQLAAQQDQLRLRQDEIRARDNQVREQQDELQALSSRIAVLQAIKEDLEREAANFARDAVTSEQALQAEIEKLSAQIVALRALKESLEREARDLMRTGEETEQALAAERELSETARAQVALLTQQMAALRMQLQALEAALQEAERRAEEQNVEIQSLGRRLNAALASRVQELSRYRSEFFGRLRTLLGDRQDIRIVGDRFIFQSEVLFATGQAVLAQEGRSQILQVAETLIDISRRIPPEINWILQVEGHTDTVPIRTERFPSNWELSTARAISVIRLLIDSGIPADRLSAAGFGEFQPLDGADTEAAYRRNRRIELRLTQR